jgi:hypothetical protein
MKFFIPILLSILINAVSFAQTKPKVWIYTDMSDKSIKGQEKEGSANDPDDISAMAGYLLMANMFDTKGIVVSSTHRKEHKTSPNQADWANRFFGDAYRKDIINLNKNISGYPDDMRFVQSCIKETAERYNAQKVYDNLENYATVKSLFELAQKETDIIHVLCWGSLTEPAILVNHCLNTNRTDVLKKLRFIAHWTNSPLHQGSLEHPENVANCREDANACAYLKKMALDKNITFYECGAIGQHGIVSGSPKGEAYFNQFKISELGKIFAEGKFAHNSVDHSDAATYWTLLGNWGVRLEDIKSDGTNTAEIEKANEVKYVQWSHRIHDELLRRAKSAAPPQYDGSQNGFSKLFNGVDFTGFYTFLREEGKNKDPKKVFTFTKDSSIHVSGEQFGYFCTTDTFTNFHLKFQFKWGDKKHAPRLDQPRDAGVLYHFQTHQKDTVWPVSLECQIQEGDCGDFWLIGGTTIKIDGVRTQPKPFQRVVKKEDAERPHGQWNTVEVITRNGNATHIINGKIVNQGSAASVQSGRIVFQSEGAELFYKNIEIKRL